MSQTASDTRIEIEHRAQGIQASRLSEPTFVEALIHPVSVFGEPREVAIHAWFTDQEKRTILLSWARDELVLEQAALKGNPELRLRSRIDAVIDALAQFDPKAAGEYRAAVASIRNPRRKAITRDWIRRPLES